MKNLFTISNASYFSLENFEVSISFYIDFLAKSGHFESFGTKYKNDEFEKFYLENDELVTINSHSKTPHHGPGFCFWLSYVAMISSFGAVEVDLLELFSMLLILAMIHE